VKADLTQRIKISESWYEATVTRRPAVALSETATCDVCVIGAGLAGLTIALELARAGKSVVLLEASGVAAGASGRNGGFVSNGFALGLSDLAARVGVSSAQALYALSRQGTEYVRTSISANDPSIQMGKGLRVCVRYQDGGQLHAYADALRGTYAEDVDVDDVSQTRAVLSTSRYFDSISFPRAFHIHPLRYALLLQALCLKQGVAVFENTAALRVELRGQARVVHCAYGKVTAQHVVFCVSSTDRTIHAYTGRAVLPVATYVAVTEPLQQDVIRTREAIADTRRAGDYYRLIDDGRILWGGRISTRRSEPWQLAGLMQRDMLSTFPKLGKPRIDYAWAGQMGYAIHKMPLIGRDAEGLWFATAFGGHGLNTTAMGGLLLARAIAGGDDEWRRFAPFEPRSLYGPLGQLGVQGSYWLMQLKDRLDEARQTSNTS
jgi:gamma-glutamylputrescine oxidase